MPSPSSLTCAAFPLVSLLGADQVPMSAFNDVTDFVEDLSLLISLGQYPVERASTQGHENMHALGVE